MPSNYRALVGYDGTRYAGFQTQQNAPTVQDEIERALSALAGEKIRIAGAGRTDAGVHASGQVISFRTARALDGEELRRGVNALLPGDIAVLGVEPAGEEFHARYSATGRTYEYRVRNAPARDPLERHREHWVPRPLELGAMEQAAAMLVGRHDFSAFAAGPGGTRTVRRAEWSRDGTLVRFEIEADAFLRGMVRAMVGTLLWVGRGKIGADDLRGVLEGRDRARAGPSAPANGLCLIAVSYGSDARSVRREAGQTISRDDGSGDGEDE